MVERLTSWTYSGFNVHCGEVIPPEDITARERAARYLVRSCVSLEKMTYLPREGKILYGDASDTKSYEPLDFLALLSCHITDRWERRVIPYGFWSNKSRGMRKKQETSEEVQIIEPKLSSKTYRKRWAAWINKIWNTDPLICPKCGATLEIIAFIEDHAVIKNILTSLDLWKIPERPPPKPLLQDLDEYEIAS